MLYRFEREQYFEVYQAIEGNATIKGSGRGRGGDIGGSGIFKAPENETENDGEDEEESDDSKKNNTKNNDDGGEALASLSGKRIEDVYGCEHLLRLFGKFFFFWFDRLRRYPHQLT